MKSPEAYAQFLHASWAGLPTAPKRSEGGTRHDSACADYAAIRTAMAS
jgi:hypothetical protein